MCDMCWQTPCHPRCPNAPEPLVIHYCIHCGVKIREGDCYYDIDGEPWCEDCIREACTYAERSCD